MRTRSNSRSTKGVESEMPQPRIASVKATAQYRRIWPPTALLQSLEVSNWPTWGCEISALPRTDDEPKTCLLLQARPHWLTHPAGAC